MICKYKYMHLTNLSKTDVKKIKVKIDDEVLSIAFRPQKRYTNILVEARKIDILENDSNIAFEFTDFKQFNKEQLDFDKRYNVTSKDINGELIHYSIIGDPKTAKKILVTFPGISSFDNVHHRLSALTSVQDILCGNAIIIAFQDRQGVYGNYMYKTDNNTYIKALVESVIDSQLVSMGLEPSDLIFYGNSKGGSICFDYVEKYKRAHFFIDIPQIDLFNYQSQNDLLRYSLGEDCRRHHVYLDEVKKLSSERVTYSFAENDYDASRNVPAKEITGINVAVLKDSGHSGAAMKFVLRQMTKISQIINDSDPVNRPALSTKISIDTNQKKMFFVRRLGAFKKEDDLKHLFSEIKFISNNKPPISISLNQYFDGKTVVVSWRKGFNYDEYFSNLHFKEIHLIVYFRFKEFVYPLSDYELLN